MNIETELKQAIVDTICFECSFTLWGYKFGLEIKKSLEKSKLKDSEGTPVKAPPGVFQDSYLFFF